MATHHHYKQVDHPRADAPGFREQLRSGAVVLPAGLGALQGRFQMSPSWAWPTAFMMHAVGMRGRLRCQCIAAMA